MKFLKEVNTETVKYKAKGQGIDVAIEKVGMMTSTHTIIITMTTSPHTNEDYHDHDDPGRGGSLLGASSGGEDEGPLAQDRLHPLEGRGERLFVIQR